MESTLSISRADLLSETGRFLGWGRDPSQWSDDQTQDVDQIVASGLRQFYNPPPLPGESSSYDWSFLKPRIVLPLPSGVSTILLPEDFGGVEGTITVVGINVVQWPLKPTSIGYIEQAYAQIQQSTGRPLMAATRPRKETTQASGQRWELMVYPLPDQDYNLQFSYYFYPNRLNEQHPYPYGGMMHAETIREACLMAAEVFLDDAQGNHQSKFLERLAASISMDRRNKPQTLGINHDRSDLLDRQYRVWPGYYDSVVSYNGVVYDG